MQKRETQFNTNPYREMFRDVVSECHTKDSNNKLLGVTVYYDAKCNKMSKGKLLDKIMKLSPAPHGIFEDNDGYLLRFELLEPIVIADDEYEDKLRRSILRFLRENAIVQGELQEMEIGRWVTHLAIPDEREVQE